MKFSNKNAKSDLLKEQKDNLEGNIDQNDPFSFDPSFSQRPDSLKGIDFGDNFGDFPGFGAEPKEPVKPRKIEMIFNRLDMEKQRSVEREVKELVNVAREEIRLLKVQDQGLVADIEKLTLPDMPKELGIYHVRFLEFVIRLLRTIRKKVSEGRLWVQATANRNAKKFRGKAKRYGTSFSMSKELSQANLPG